MSFEFVSEDFSVVLSVVKTFNIPRSTNNVPGNTVNGRDRKCSRRFVVGEDNFLAINVNGKCQAHDVIGVF